MKGLFLTFEGPDGSGKTTQIGLLKTYLELKGIEVEILREPGGTKISENIRDILLDNKNSEMSPVCEALLYAASRAQLVDEKIKRLLEGGKVVICDRFYHSSIVYQGFARGLSIDFIRSINRVEEGIIPNSTFLLMLSPDKGINRKKKEKELDRLEMEKIEFHNKVYDGYNIIKESYKNITEIDGTLSIEEIHKQILGRVDSLLEDRGGIL